MVKITKRVVEAAEVQKKDYLIWDDELPGFGLRVFPNHWKHLFEDSPLSDVTPHVLRHSFASIANDLGFTEMTIAALVGLAWRSVSGPIHATVSRIFISRCASFASC